MQQPVRNMMLYNMCPYFLMARLCKPSQQFPLATVRVSKALTFQCVQRKGRTPGKGSQATLESREETNKILKKCAFCFYVVLC